MKRITKVEQIETEVTIFGCDFCDFESYDEEDVIKHHGEAHAVKKQVTIEGTELYYFETIEDARSWLDKFCEYYDQVDVNWDSPGWYIVADESGRCAKDCCYQLIKKLKPASDHLENIILDIKNNMMHLESELYRLNGFKKQIDALKNPNDSKRS